MHRLDTSLAGVDAVLVDDATTRGDAINERALDKHKIDLFRATNRARFVRRRTDLFLEENLENGDVRSRFA